MDEIVHLCFAHLFVYLKISCVRFSILQRSIFFQTDRQTRRWFLIESSSCCLLWRVPNLIKTKTFKEQKSVPLTLLFPWDYRVGWPRTGDVTMTRVACARVTRWGTKYAGKGRGSNAIFVRRHTGDTRASLLLHLWTGVANIMGFFKSWNFLKKS